MSRTKAQSPRFFEISHSFRDFAYIETIDNSKELECNVCKNCGRDMDINRLGKLTAHVEGTPRWPDCIQLVDWDWGNCQFALSARVIDVFKKSGIKGYKSHPISKLIKFFETKKVPRAPQYFFVQITGQIDINIPQSGGKVVSQCPVCFKSKVSGALEKYVPKIRTWDGSDIFCLRNYPTLSTFCTRRVLDLAQAHRWTGFNFHCMDGIIKHRTGKYFDGIDYLGNSWPPKAWYPIPPRHGK